MAIPHGNASIICGASYHVWDLPSVIICDDAAKDPSDRLSLLTSAKSYISKLRYLARYFPANIPWPMTGPHDCEDVHVWVRSVRLLTAKQEESLSLSKKSQSTPCRDNKDNCDDDDASTLAAMMVGKMACAQCFQSLRIMRRAVKYWLLLK